MTGYASLLVEVLHRALNSANLTILRALQ